MAQERESLARFDGFKQLYERELEPALHAMEAERRRAWRQMIGQFLTWGLFVSAVGAMLAGFVLQWPLEGYLVWFLFLSVTMLSVIYSLFLGKVRAKVKRALMDGICGFLDLVYSEKPTGRIKPRAFVEAGLIDDYSNGSSKMEDEISGSFNDVEFAMVEVVLKKRVRNRKGEITEVTVFEGLLAGYSFPKRFHGRTRVFRGGSVYLESEQTVHLEDPEFGRLFDVYSTDQVEARYILTPGFMEKLKEMERHMLGTVRLSFHEDRLFIGLETFTDFFEAGSMFSTLIDVDRATRIARQIHLLFMIPDTLDLDGLP